MRDYNRTDDEIEKILARQVLSFPFLKGEWIDFEVIDGVVKFEGVVFRPRFKAFVSRIAWELSGVKDCFNLVRVDSIPQIANSKAYPLAEVYFENRFAV